MCRGLSIIEDALKLSKICKRSHVAVEERKEMMQKLLDVPDRKQYVEGKRKELNIPNRSFFAVYCVKVYDHGRIRQC